MIFRAPGLVTGGFLYGNMLKAAELISSQWSNNFNDSIYVGGKDYSPTAISGFGFAFKTTASNQKIQSISIKQDHTVIRKVMTFLEIICVLMRGQYNYHCSSSAS